MGDLVFYGKPPDDPRPLERDEPDGASTSPVRSFAKSNQQLLESFETYLVSMNRSEPTRRAYLNSVGRFIEVLGSKDAVEADRSDIRRFQSTLLARGVCANSIRLHTSGIRAFSQFLRLGGLTRHDPTLLLSHRRLPSRVPRVLTVKEIEQLIDACESFLEKAVVEVLYSTGVRISELVRIRLEDITFTQPGVIRVKRGKGDKDRIVLFGRRAAKAVRNYLGARRTGFLFEAPECTGELFRNGASWWGRISVDGVQRSIRFGKIRDSRSHDVEKVKALRASGLSWQKIGERTGLSDETATRVWNNPHLYTYLSEAEARAKFERWKAETQGFRARPRRPYHVRVIRTILYRVASRANVPGVHPHALRRAFATHLLEGGASLRIVQELLGHENLTTTMLYTNLSGLSIKQVHDRCHPHAKETINGKKN